MSDSKTNSGMDGIALAILIALLLIGKLLVLLDFGFRYVSSDGLIYWQMATDYSKGVFHEPYFYGQNYGFALEAIFAVPFLWFGIQPNVALPLATTLLAVTPFLVFSLVLYFRGFRLSAFLILLVPLTLPVEYDMITSMPRGFVQGLFFCSFLIVPILKPRRVGSIVVLGICSSFAYVVNPNSLIFLLPVGLYIFLANLRSRKFYLIFGFSAVPAFIALYLAQRFYVENPHFLMHWSWDFQFAIRRLLDAFDHMDQFFRFLMPIIWKGHWLVILLVFVFGLVVFRRDRKKGSCVMAGVGFSLLMMGVLKVNDDIGTIFLSSTRMYLAIPLFLGLSVHWVVEQHSSSSRFKILVLLLATAFLFKKASIRKEVIASHTEEMNYGAIAIAEVSDLNRRCEKIQQLVERYDIDLIIFVPSHEMNASQVGLLDYGCPILSRSNTLTVLAEYERRTWAYYAAKNYTRGNLLLYNCRLIENLPLGNLDYQKIGGFPESVVLADISMSVPELMKQLNIPFKRNPHFNDH